MFDNFPWMRRMSQKLIFMKIQDGRQDDGHMNPIGHDLILGPSKILEPDTITIIKNVG